MFINEFIVRRDLYINSFHVEGKFPILYNSDFREGIIRFNILREHEHILIKDGRKLL